MANKSQPNPDATPMKDSKEWTTGEEPMTGPQCSYLGTLAREAGEPVAEELTTAEASKKIDELQDRTGRGAGGGRKKAAKQAPRRNNKPRRR